MGRGWVPFGAVFDYLVWVVVAIEGTKFLFSPGYGVLDSASVMATSEAVGWLIKMGDHFEELGEWGAWKGGCDRE